MYICITTKDNNVGHMNINNIIPGCWKSSVLQDVHLNWPGTCKDPPGKGGRLLLISTYYYYY